MILPIYIYGQPVLRKVAEDVTPEYPELKTLIANMFETLDASNGVGLAAPQIGLAIRVVVIDLDVLSEEFPEYKGFRKAFINAHILEYDDESEGYLARVMQHEFDHLEGTMFIDRLSPLRKNMIAGKLKNILKGKFRCSYRTKIRH